MFFSKVEVLPSQATPLQLALSFQLLLSRCAQRGHDCQLRTAPGISVSRLCNKLNRSIFVSFISMDHILGVCCTCHRCNALWFGVDIPLFARRKLGDLEGCTQ